MSDDLVDPRLILPPESGQRLPSLSRAIPMLANYLGLRADPLRMRQATVVASASQTDATVQVQYADEPGTKYAEALNGIRPAVGDTVWLTEQPPDEPLLVGIQGDASWDKFAWEPYGTLIGTWPGGNPRPKVWTLSAAFNTDANADTIVLSAAQIGSGGVLAAIGQGSSVFALTIAIRNDGMGNLVARVWNTTVGGLLEPAVSTAVAMTFIIFGWVV
jgi:hypothetical protein